MTLPSPTPFRRGGQAGNTNAFRHGQYSAFHPSRLAHISASLRTLGQGVRISPAISHITAARRLYPSLLKLAAPSAPIQQQLAAIRLTTRLLSFIVRLKYLIHNLSLDERRLRETSENAIVLIQYSIMDHGITRDADSFLEAYQKSDQNSAGRQAPTVQRHQPGRPPDIGSLDASQRPCPSGISPQNPHPFLTDDQWAVLEPLIPDKPSASTRGRPATDPRLLLDTIFWKLTTGSTWDHLPPGHPSMLVCRRYYRRLYLSGRLTTLYRHLFHHLEQSGVNLPNLNSKGFFRVGSRHKLVLSPECPPTWQNRTALLFMQQGWLALNSLCRRNTADRLRQGRRFRFPSFTRRYKPRPLRIAAAPSEEDLVPIWTALERINNRSKKRPRPQPLTLKGEVAVELVGVEQQRCSARSSAPAAWRYSPDMHPAPHPPPATGAAGRPVH